MQIDTGSSTTFQFLNHGKVIGQGKGVEDLQIALNRLLAHPFRNIVGAEWSLVQDGQEVITGDPAPVAKAIKQALA